MSTIAVFGILGGGGAWAAGKIGAGDIQPNAVRSNHIKEHQVKKGDLAANAALGGRGSMRTGIQANPTTSLKTLIKLPRIGRLAVSCSDGAGNETVYLQNRSGKELVVSAFRGSSAVAAASYGRTFLPDGEDVQIVQTAGGSPFAAAMLSIEPSNVATRPYAVINVTARQSCGISRALVIGTEG